MLYLGYGLLRYVLIYNLEVSFNFHWTFLNVQQYIDLARPKSEALVKSCNAKRGGQ